MFPGLITILGAFLWNDIREIKNDVKALIAQSNVDKTRIDGLEREVFGTERTNNIPSQPSDNEPFNNIVFIKPGEYHLKKKPYRPYISSTN